MLAFLDDMTIVGPPSALGAAYAVLREQIALVGLSVQPRKCLLYSPSPASLALAAAEPSISELPSTTSGLRLLGIPIGSEAFVTDFQRTALAALQSDMEQLPELLDPQVGFALLRECVSTRAPFFMRTVDPSAGWWQGLEGLDERIWQVLRRLLGEEIGVIGQTSVATALAAAVRIAVTSPAWARQAGVPVTGSNSRTKPW